MGTFARTLHPRLRPGFLGSSHSPLPALAQRLDFPKCLFPSACWSDAGCAVLAGTVLSEATGLRTSACQLWEGGGLAQRARCVTPAQLQPLRARHPHAMLSHTRCSRHNLYKTLSSWLKRAPTKLNEVKSYHLCTPQKTHSIITVKSKPVSQAAGTVTSAPHHAALKALHSAKAEMDFITQQGENTSWDNSSSSASSTPAFSTIINNRSC